MGDKQSRDAGDKVRMHAFADHWAWNNSRTNTGLTKEYLGGDNHTQSHHPDSTYMRSVSLFLVLPPFSFLESMALGIQYQLDDRFALGLKASVAYLHGRGHEEFFPPGGVGGGIKVSYYFQKTGQPRFLNVNVINFEASYLSPVIEKTPGRRYHGSEIELTLGHDGLEGRGFGFLWALGAAASFATSLPPLFFPALKLGIHYDF